MAEDEPPRDRGQVPSATDNQPRSMERDYDFVERPSQDFFCPVTLELLLEPRQLSCCGNHLSREAATRLQREGKLCPMCNEQEWNVVLDKYHGRRVHRVRVRCPHKDSGCDWVGEVNELTQHADSCAKRPWECEYCGLKFTYGEGEGKHWPMCHKFPEPCPNRCEVGSVERCNVEQHRSVCSLEPVACEMKEFGCSAVVPRKELATHMRESELQHLTAMTMLNLRLSRQLQQDSTERDRKIAQLQQASTERDRKIAQLQQDMAELKEFTGCRTHSVCKVITFTDYTQRRREAGCNNIADSDPFYSHHHGYKFKLRLLYTTTAQTSELLMQSITNMYGLPVPRLSQYYIGIGLGQVTGEYDDQLYWPVEVKVRLELLNQAEDCHHVERTASCKWEKNERDKLHPIDRYLKTYWDLERKRECIQYMMNDRLTFRVHLTVLSA